MNLNKKTDVNHNIGFYTELKEKTNKTTMKKYKPNQNEFQFKSAIPPKIIICFNCHREREFDGYIFRLVRVCADCRTESEVLTTRKRFERREAKR